MESPTQESRPEEVAKGDRDIKDQVYRDPRPASSMDQFHEYARTHEPNWTYMVVRILLTPVVTLLYRCRAIGKENVPPVGDGGVILAPNHFSNMDHFFCGVWIRRRIRFMAKSQLYGNNAFITWLFKNAGHFPVRRGHKDPEAFITANAILDNGGTVGIYAEGGRSRSGGLGDPKPGVGRLALESGMPVVPVAIHGSKDVRGWRRGRLPKVRVAFGEPLSFDTVAEPSREQSEKATLAIFGRVKSLYDELDS